MEPSGTELAEICGLLGEETFVGFMIDLVGYVKLQDFDENKITRKFKMVNYLVQNDSKITDTKLLCFENILEASFQFLENNYESDYLKVFSVLLTNFVEHTVEYSSPKMDALITSCIKTVFEEFIENPKDFNLTILGIAVNFSLSISQSKPLKLKALNLDDKIITMSFLVPCVTLKQCLKLFSNVATSSSLEKLWNVLEKKLDKEDDKIRGLAILCYLAKEFITIRKGEKSFPLLDHRNFWAILQNNISDENRMVRKLSLYIFKRYIYEMELSQITMKTDLFSFENGEIYHVLFIILEILEGTQAHIVSQTWAELEKLIDFVGKRELNIRWLEAVFIRYFKQDSIIVLEKVVKYFISIDPKNWRNETFVHFFKCLNNMVLISKIDLENWFAPDLLDAISSVNWSPIPLFYVTKAMMKTRQNWDVGSLQTLKNFVVQSLRTQTVIIRAAIQTHLLICLKNSVSLPLSDICDVLNVFRTDECLCQGTAEWLQVCDWIKSSTTQKEADEFIASFMEKDVSLKSISRILLMLSEIGLFNSENISHKRQILAIFDDLVDCDKRAYSALEKQNASIQLIYHILNENRTKTTLTDIIYDNLYHIFLFIKLRMKSQTTDFNDTQTYVKVVELIFNNSYEKYSKEIDNLYKIAYEALLNENNALKEFLSLSIVFVYMEKNDLSTKDFMRLFKNRILGKIKDPGSELKTIHGEIVAQNLRLIWSSLAVLLKKKGVDGIRGFDLNILIEEALEALNIGGKETVLPILEVFDRILILYEDKSKVKNFINRTWKTCFEFRKSELFWKSINTWITMLFKTEIIRQKELQPIIKNFASSLLSLGNDISGLANILSRHLHAFDVGETPVIFDEVFIECLLFGPISRKDQRIELETCNYIHKQGDFYAINKLHPHVTLKSELEVRLQALNILFKNSSPRNNRFIVKIVKDLIEEDTKSMTKNKRYFNDSLVHRRKNRTLQVLLLIQKYISDRKSQFEESDVHILMFDWAIDALLSESQQPSVRYQLEILFINLCMDYKSLKSKFWNIFNKAADERIGSLTSFICIAFHLAKNDVDDDFFEDLIDNVLPCCMSQNFNLRLYAQVALEKLWPYYKKMSEKYKIVSKNQAKIFSQGNMLVNVNKLRNDFYFNMFDIRKHFTLQTIFWDLPRLSNLSKEEWISVSYLKTIVDVTKIGIQSGEKSDLSDCEMPSWVSKASEISVKDENMSIQRKFVPWKGMLSELELEEEEHNKKASGLILVTSLVDKSTNLGGLARTSDVFGIKEFVLGSLEYSKDKAFTGLSLTAEKHLNLTEVKSHNLPEYLTSMKSKGYTVVGAEQTTTSISLDQYKFPFKTVLVLGNEREGIPADVILHLDDCIEIPQFGLIRSLNVHVSGAIFLWEYAKQHLGS